MTETRIRSQDILDGTILPADLDPSVAAGGSWTTPEDHGAAGNGVADDTTEVQAAINTGLDVYLPNVYKVTAKLTLATQGQRIFGDGFLSRIIFPGDTCPVCIGMVDTTQRQFIQLVGFRISSSVVNTGLAVDASHFATCYLDLFIDGPCNQGVDFNSNDAFYNTLRARIAVAGSGSFGVRFANGANENTLTRMRIATDSNSTGVIVDAHSCDLYDVDVETGAAVGIDIRSNGHETTLHSPYLEANVINLKLASGVRSPVLVGGTIISGTTANVQDLGAAGFVRLNTALNFASTPVLISMGSTPQDAVFLDTTLPTSIGTRDSHGINLRGSYHDGTSAHTSDWRELVNVTSSAGGSKYRWMQRTDAASFVEKMSIDGAGVLTTGGRIITGGPIQTPYAAKTADYTIVANTDSVIRADASGVAGSTLTITLPTAASIQGRGFVIKRINSGSKTVTVNTTSSQTIDGATSVVLANQWDSIVVVSDGANWMVMPYTTPNRLLESSGPTLLTVGSVADGEYVKRSGTTLIGGTPSGGGGGGSTDPQLDFVPRTTDFTANGSSGAQVKWIQGNSVTYDGATRIKIEAFAALVAQGSSAIIVELWDDTAGVSLGRILDSEGPSGDSHTVYGAAFLTPVAGARIYSLRAWKNGGTDGTIYGSTGLGSWLRITKAAGGAPLGGGGSYQLDYVEATSVLTVTATSDATAQAYITGNGVTYDGATRVKIEAFIPLASFAANQAVLLNLYDGSTDLGRLANVQAINATGAGGSGGDVIKVERWLTPSAGSHTFSIRAWKTGGTASLTAGSGGAGAWDPAFLRISTDSVVAPDGWISDSAETWTYASATTFTVPGDLTAKYTPGTRIRLTQTTAKYFVVVSSSFSSPNTTVTVTGGSDYTLANAAISANYHSYLVNPQGYPTWFNYSVAATGFSGTPTQVGRFSVVGRAVTVYIRVSGTSNATTFTVAVPIAAESEYLVPVYSPQFVTDSGTLLSGGRYFFSASTTLTLAKTMSGTTFTASGTKETVIQTTYQF